VCDCRRMVQWWSPVNTSDRRATSETGCSVNTSPRRWEQAIQLHRCQLLVPARKLTPMGSSLPRIPLQTSMGLELAGRTARNQKDGQSPAGRIPTGPVELAVEVAATVELLPLHRLRQPIVPTPQVLHHHPHSHLFERRRRPEPSLIHAPRIFHSQVLLARLVSLALMESMERTVHLVSPVSWDVVEQS